MEKPKQEHFKIAKIIPRYVKRSTYQGLLYTQNKVLRLGS